MGPDGHGIGCCVILNSGCMSHGLIGAATSGLSKALCMTLSVIVAPLKETEPMDFRKAWYALDVSSIEPLRWEILTVLNASVTKYFWVS